MGEVPRNLQGHSTGHELGELLPTPVFQGVDDGSRDTVQDHSSPRGSKGYPPILALETNLPGDTSRPLRKLTPWAAGWRQGPEAKTAHGADQLLVLLRGNPLPAGEASPGEEEPEELRRQGPGVQVVWNARRAARIASREGLLPHQRSKDTAP